MGIQSTLLIVDGHAGVREALARRLAQLSPMRVIAAADLDGAQWALVRHAPAAIVYDPKTVQGNAPRVLAQLVATGVPIVVLTSSLLEGEAAMLRREGAAAVLLKGVGMTTLLAAIESVKSARSASGQGQG